MLFLIVETISQGFLPSPCLATSPRPSGIGIKWFWHSNSPRRNPYLFQLRGNDHPIYSGSSFFGFFRHHTNSSTESNSTKKKISKYGCLIQKFFKATGIGLPSPPISALVDKMTALLLFFFCVPHRFVLNYFPLWLERIAIRANPIYLVVKSITLVKWWPNLAFNFKRWFPKIWPPSPFLTTKPGAFFFERFYFMPHSI